MNCGEMIQSNPNHDQLILIQSNTADDLEAEHNTVLSNPHLGEEKLLLSLNMGCVGTMHFSIQFNPESAQDV